MKIIASLILLVFYFIGSSSINATEKTFTFITEEQPPYAGTKLKDYGWAWVVTKMAVESQGYTAKLRIDSWARAVEDSKQGVADALFLAFWTEERLQWYEYTVPVAQIKSGLFKLKERTELTFNGDLKTLKKFTIGICRSCAVADEFDLADYLKKQVQKNTRNSLKMLFANRLDFVAANKPTAEIMLKTLEEDYKGISNEIVFLEPALQINDLLVGISKKAPNYKEKLRDFNRGIKKLFLDGTYHKIQAQYGFK